MTLLIVAAIAIALFGAVVGWQAVAGLRHSRSQRRARNRRLAANYPIAVPSDKVVPLPKEKGHAAVQRDGLYLQVGGQDVFYHVPWEATRSTISAGGGSGGIVVGISKVGDIVVPGTLGRSIWSYTVGKGARPVARTERARSVGV